MKYLSLIKFINQLPDNELKDAHKETCDMGSKIISKDAYDFKCFYNMYDEKVLVWRYNTLTFEWHFAFVNLNRLSGMWGDELRNTFSSFRYYGPYRIPEFDNMLGINLYRHESITDYAVLLQYLVDKNNLNLSQIAKMFEKSKIETENPDDVYKIKYEGKEYKRQGEYSYLTSINNQGYFKTLIKVRDKISENSDYYNIQLPLYVVQIMDNLSYEQLKDYVSLFSYFVSSLSNQWISNITGDTAIRLREKYKVLLEHMNTRLSELMKTEPQWVTYKEYMKNDQIQTYVENDIPMNIVINTKDSDFI